MLIVFVGVIVAWWVAYTLALNLYDDKNRIGLLWVGALSGFVGAGVTSIALWIASEDFRTRANLISDLRRARRYAALLHRRQRLAPGAARLGTAVRNLAGGYRRTDRLRARVQAKAFLAVIPGRRAKARRTRNRFKTTSAKSFSLKVILDSGSRLRASGMTWRKINGRDRPGHDDFTGNQNPATAEIGRARSTRSRFISSAIRNASSSACSALSRGSQCV